MKNKGISLITVIITIVVIVILSTVIILTLTNNNPINSSKIASISQTSDSIESAIRIYLGKVRADTLGKYSTTQIILGSKEATLVYKISDGVSCYIEEKGKNKKVYRLDTESLKQKVELNIDELENKLNWYIDDKGKAYLVYNALEEMPEYLKDNNNILTTVSAFVKLKSTESVTPQVDKLEASISFENDTVTKVYGDSNFTNTLINTGDGIVTYSSSASNIAKVNREGRVEIKGTGTVTITAEVSDTETKKYSQKTASYTLIISQKEVSVPTSPESKRYNGSSQEHGITIPDGVEIVSEESTLSATAQGTYTVVLKLSSANYIWENGTTTNKSIIWEIIRPLIPASISFRNASEEKEYGDALFTNYLTNTGDGTVTYLSSNTSVATINEYGIVSITGTGETIITATVGDTEDYTYATKTISYTLTVNPESLTIPSSPTDVSYDGQSHNHGITIPTGAEIVTASSTLSATNPGTYTVVVKLSNSNYIWSDNSTTNKNITWTIVDNRTAASISFTNASMTKETGDALFTNYLTNTGDGVVTYTSSDETVATINENGMVSILTTGETTITATVSDTLNYTYATKSVSYTLTVLQATTITGMTGGDLEVSATVTTDSNNTDFTNSKYVFTTSNTPLGTTDTTIYSDGTISSATYTAKAAKVAGTYYLHVLVASTNGTLKEVISSSTAVCQGVKDFAYTGSAQNITLPKGTYKLEVWGAEGGSGNAYKSSLLGGKGGYSKGNLTLTTNTDIYVYVGGKGNVKNAVDEIVDGGYNGGGNNGCTSKFSSGSGGGGTDIRLGSTTVFARIIVAGGGGGSTGRNDNKYGSSGGAGGGTTGTRATNHIDSKYQSGYPGTQSSGGSGYTQNATGADAVSSGEFFQGANKAAEKNVSGGRWRRLVWWRLRILCWISRWLRLGIYH